jgi:hypothetical protein
MYQLGDVVIYNYQDITGGQDIECEIVAISITRGLYNTYIMNGFVLAPTSVLPSGKNNKVLETQSIKTIQSKCQFYKEGLEDKQVLCYNSGRVVLVDALIYFKKLVRHAAVVQDLDIDENADRGGLKYL